MYNFIHLTPDVLQPGIHYQRTYYGKFYYKFKKRTNAF